MSLFTNSVNVSFWSSSIVFEYKQVVSILVSNNSVDCRLKFRRKYVIKTKMRV